MKEQEYKEKLQQLAKNYEREQKILASKYAHKNNPYKIGDIITDHIGSGRILRCLVHIGMRSALPCMVYECENLTKIGGVNKREPKRSIYQSNIIQ